MLLFFLSVNCLLSKIELFKVVDWKLDHVINVIDLNSVHKDLIRLLDIWIWELSLRSIVCLWPPVCLSDFFRRIYRRFKRCVLIDWKFRHCLSSLFYFSLMVIRLFWMWLLLPGYNFAAKRWDLIWLFDLLLCWFNRIQLRNYLIIPYFWLLICIFRLNNC